MNKMNDSLQAKNEEVYLNGIRKFITRGVPVYIDGVNAKGGRLEQLLSPPEGTFYMADFVMEEFPESAYMRENPLSMVREGTDDDGLSASASAQDRYFLKEIRFDKVYHS